MRPLKVVIAAMPLTLALVALPAAFDGAATAWAGNANGHANGHANGNSAGNAGGSSNSSGGTEVASNSHGATASSLGSLNAAHASPTALANASPNSTVGKLAIYRDSTLAARTAQDAYDALAVGMVLKYDGLDLSPPDGVLSPAETALMTPEDMQALADAAAAITTNQATADTALADAANKPITDDVIDAVNELLGLN
jgi:hypothetical protein